MSLDSTFNSYLFETVICLTIDFGAHSSGTVVLNKICWQTGLGSASISNLVQMPFQWYTKGFVRLFATRPRKINGWTPRRNILIKLSFFLTHRPEFLLYYDNGFIVTLYFFHIKSTTKNNNTSCGSAGKENVCDDWKLAWRVAARGGQNEDRLPLYLYLYLRHDMSATSLTFKKG